MNEAKPPFSVIRFTAAVVISLPAMYVGTVCGPLAMFIPVFTGVVGGRLIRRPYLGAVAGFLGGFIGGILTLSIVMSLLWNYDVTLAGYFGVLAEGFIGGISGLYGGKYGIRQWREKNKDK